MKKLEWMPRNELPIQDGHYWLKDRRVTSKLHVVNIITDRGSRVLRHGYEWQGLCGNSGTKLEVFKQTHKDFMFAGPIPKPE